ncbi:ABC-type antimicrobial peptide transport system, permease component [Sinomicrobium oceani]|uniref:ABC-type antimicrobial peptide transport system, permease component n=1 Tax=Sinomicrobium oceani TaxID=1150368 RepID=A0A1K1LQN6_9FLAO|nr:ABC transporter permease [Sinomicrobium oceani]SFW13221.1 ABC-type antimicrobial peptide transport system, permease component [Sinomicrobium oceani]
MIRNYIKIAFRNLWKNRIFSGLNSIGLTIAFTIALLLCMTAVYNLSFDRFHQNADHTYLIYYRKQVPKGAKDLVTLPSPFSQTLKDEVPGVDRIARYTENSLVAVHKDKEIYVDIAYSDPDFFSIFTFPELEGNATRTLQDKSGIVITQKTAKKLFGTDQVLGQTLSVIVNGQEEPYTIGAVLSDIPKQSSMDFDLVLNYTNISGYDNRKDSWDSKNHQEYLTLEKGVSVKDFEKNTRAFTALHFEQEIKVSKRDGAQPDENGEYMQMRLLPFRDHHFIRYSNQILSVSRTFPYMILGIAGLIVFIACVNFINMNIGTNLKRLREIGVRKTLGAEKKQLFFQFWMESVLIFAFALTLGIFMSWLLLPEYKNLFRTGADFSSILSPASILISFWVFAAITCIAGGYPAYVLSKLGTVQTLKGKVETGGKHRLRSALIVVQFCIAILLISCTLVISDQIRYLTGKDLGFDKEQVISFPLNGKNRSRLDVDLLRNELSGKPGILSMTASDNNLGLGRDGSRMTSRLGFEYHGREITTDMLIVDYDYPETLGIPLASGRSFSRDFATDSLSILINESMATEIGEKDALHTTMNLDNKQYTVIGIVKNYHFEDMHKTITPITFFLRPTDNPAYAYVKVGPGNLSASLAIVEKAWKKIEPNAEFLGSYLDENIDRTLRDEKNMASLVTSGAVIAIILSCIGIFAISLLTIAQRTKEIGIRKVVGASTTTITVLLSKDFLKLVLIAFIIVTPVSWWFLQQWLQSYAYRIDLSIWLFLIAGSLTMVIAFATLSIRTIKAAMANPVKSLKTDG